MDKNYINTKVQEALKKAGNNHMRAATYLLEMAEEDELLYSGLTAPFLHSAATFAVQRYLSKLRREQTSPKARRPLKSVGELTDEDLGALVKRMANSSTSSDDEFWSGKGPANTTPTSKAHAKNLEKIAGAFSGTKKESDAP